MARLRADVLLVERGLFDSRAKARAAIEAGLVAAAGRAVAKASELLDADVALEARAAHPWVGRGGVKLAHALERWPIAVDGKVVLDIGASTGGFTEVCLQAGARLVYAVDVGRGQLHPRVAADPRVVSLEAIDVRRLSPDLAPQTPELLVCDVSFISLAKALPAALALAAPGADLVALVKPQFEVGPGDVGKGGVVRDEAARKRALDEVERFLADAGWRLNDRTDSPILGGDGNVEYLVWATKT